MICLNIKPKYSKIMMERPLVAVLPRLTRTYLEFPRSHLYINSIWKNYPEHAVKSYMVPSLSGPLRFKLLCNKPIFLKYFFPGCSSMAILGENLLSTGAKNIHKRVISFIIWTPIHLANRDSIFSVYMYRIRIRISYW